MEGLRLSGVGVFSNFFVMSKRKVAVSFSSCVKIIGMLKSKIIERSIPRIAFGWILKLANFFGSERELVPPSHPSCEAR